MRYRQIYSGTLYSLQQTIYKLQVYSTMYSLQQIVAILRIAYVGTGGWVLALVGVGRATFHEYLGRLDK